MRVRAYNANVRSFVAFVNSSGWRNTLSSFSLAPFAAVILLAPDAGVEMVDFHYPAGMGYNMAVELDVTKRLRHTYINWT